MKKQTSRHLTVLILLFLSYSANSQINTVEFSFTFDSIKYSGLINLPKGREAKSMVIIVPGSGKTDFVKGNWYYDLRAFFVNLGFAVCAWDKAGCGKSEGKFDNQQPVQSSAKEALAAIAELRHQKISGSDKIGLWGISRAGWICPLIIEEDSLIAFWISVSGVDSLENSNYLLEANLKINGKSDSEVSLLMAERLEGSRIIRNGGSFEKYVAATQNLKEDSLNITLFGKYTQETYLQDQKWFMDRKNRFSYDEKSGSMIFFPGFDKILKKIPCPVLAIFGEKDAQVDWQKTMTLYKETIGKTPQAEISIKSFPDCNHNIQKCETGGLFENLEKYNWQTCDGYYDTIKLWVQNHGFIK